MNRDLQMMFENITNQLNNKDHTIEALRKQNAYLNSEHYKDEELARMKKELDEAKADLNRGFGITEEEAKAIRDWEFIHSKAVHDGSYGGAIGGLYEYVFTPTSIGVIGVVRCHCGAEFCFEDI